MAPDSPQMTVVGSKTSPDGPKMASKLPEMPRGARALACGAAAWTKSSTQPKSERSKTAPDAVKMSQEGSETGQVGAKVASK